MKKNKLLKKSILFIPIFIIMIISFFTMYKCSLINSYNNNNLIKQIIWYIIFFIILIFNKNKNMYFKYANYLYIINIILLILVLIIGSEINGARAWLSFKFVSFQPSELMKFSYILVLCNLLSNYKYTNTKNELILLLKIFLLFIIPSILIFLEPDTGAIIYLIIISIIMILLSNIRKRWIIILLLLISICILCFFYLYFYNTDLLIKLIGTSFFYRVDRIINISDNIQIKNALIAIGNASYFGTKNNYIYIPESTTDFAYSITINSIGFIGSILISICYIMIDYYFINIIYKSKNKTTILFTSGFISIFIFNQLYNIFMNIGILPIMGIPLPFLSYGGSNLIVISLFISIILRLNKV